MYFRFQSFNCFDTFLFHFQVLFWLLPYWEFLPSWRLPPEPHLLIQAMVSLMGPADIEMEVPKMISMMMNSATREGLALGLLMVSEVSIL